MVKALDIFEKVNLILAVEQRRFFNSLNDTIDELKITFPDIVVKVNEVEYPQMRCGRLEDRIEGLDSYVGAIVDNIVYLSGGDETYKGEFVRKAELAHNADNYGSNKGRIVKRMRW